jgi:hypothetical protein
MLYVKPDGSNDFKTWKKLSQADDITLAREAERVFGEYWTAARPHFERFKNNDAYYRGAHWDLVPEQDAGEPRPHTPVLWSTVDNVHADLVEARPAAAIVAQTPDDTGKAENVSALFKCLLNRIGFTRTWHDLTAGLVRQGADVLEVFWDKSLYGGLGDVNMQRWSIRNFLFDPYVADINESAAVIKFKFERIDQVKALYPEKAADISSTGAWGPEAVYEGNWGRDLVLVYDFWWREAERVHDVSGFEDVQHKVYWCKVAGGTVVARSAKDRKGGGRSVYAHGRYPFVVIPYDRIEGSLYGLGVVDRFKQVQWFIDLTDQMVLKNLFVSARNKMLVSDGAGIDMEALRNWKTDIIRGRDISPAAVRWFDKAPFANAQLEYSAIKIAQMKDESGQNDFSRGEAEGGVTAAAAIKALQEAASKRSRKRLDMIYSCCEEAFGLALKLMGEFYTEKRQFVLSFEGKKVLKEISRKDLLTARGSRMIDFDLSIHAEKTAGYKTAYNNQQALQLLQTGMIDAEVALEMMDFERKDEVLAMLRKKKEEEKKRQEEKAGEKAGGPAQAPASGMPGPAGGGPDIASMMAMAGRGTMPG